MPRRIITEEELREAAREVLEYELAIFDSYNDYPDHIFHGKFRLNMAALIHEVKRGAVKAAKYSMGFTFYAKQCIAAVLILFTLSCIAMPETVLAGYHKLIEVIETVFEDYTEYRYRVNDDGGIEETFKPLKLGYLPEGFELAEKNKDSKSVLYVYKNDGGEYLAINQKELNTSYELMLWIDNDDVYKINGSVYDKNIEFYVVDNTLYFMWTQDKYRFLGQTNLIADEVLEILQYTEF
jgi:hypothetical protein